MFVGQVGENDYDAEGGDDLMSQNAAIDRNAGAGGFDWAIHQYDTVGADDDMAINNNLVGLPLPVVVNRDRWQETEADSGRRSTTSSAATTTCRAPSAAAASPAATCSTRPAWTASRGLAAAAAAAHERPLGPVAGASANGVCPLSGPVWGEGNILLGGAGSDTIEGRGADDIIDGDKALTARISIGTTPGRLMLQAALFAGTVDLLDLVVVREIVSPRAGTDPDPSTRPCSGPRSNDSATFGPRHGHRQPDRPRRGCAEVSDGIDTLRNVGAPGVLRHDRERRAGRRPRPGRRLLATRRPGRRARRRRSTGRR